MERCTKCFSDFVHFCVITEILTPLTIKFQHYPAFKFDVGSEKVGGRVNRLAIMLHKSNGATLLGLPLEIRESIYDYVMRPVVRQKHYNKTCYTFDVALFRVCSQIGQESQDVFKRKYHIVLFRSNSSVVGDMAAQNSVPVINVGTKASICRNYVMRVTVSYAGVGASADMTDKHLTAILLEDLPKFCKAWFYWYGKNSLWEKHITIDFNDNGSAIFSNGKIPIHFQEKLLLPFGILCTKDCTKIKGQWHDHSVEHALREMIESPEATPLERLEECENIKNCGNEALTSGNHQKALDFYIRALDEIFVVCSGRHRLDTRKSFFDVILHDGHLPSHSGMEVYFLLRAKIAANILQTYLKMENYEETLFWGTRAIDTMHEYQENYNDRLAMGTPANDAVGRIFYRTGVAAKALGDESEARHLFRVAQDYLPRDEQIKRDLASVALRIG